MKLFATLATAAAATVLLIASPALAGPFGVEKGTPKSQLNILRVVDESTPFKTYEISVTQPNGEISFYDVDLTDKTGVCRLTAFGNSHYDDNTGAAIRPVFNSFKDALTKKYGKSDDFDYLHDGSKLTAPDQFSEGLDSGERSLISFWDSDTTTMPADIQSISLEAEAIDKTSTYVVVTYEYSNFNDCFAMKPRDNSSDSKGL